MKPPKPKPTDITAWRGPGFEGFVCFGRTDLSSPWVFLDRNPPKDGSGATQKAQEPYDLCADGCRPEKQEEGLRVRVCSWTCSMLSCTDTDKQRDNGQRCLHYLGCKDLRFKGVTACRLKDPMVEGFTGCLVDDSFKIP